MGKKIIVIGGIIVVVLVVIFLILNLLGVFYSLNDLFPQNPKLSCKLDSDCKLYAETWGRCRLCESCENYDSSDEEVFAINKDWKPFCPFSKPAETICLACNGGIFSLNPTNVKCVDKECQKILG